MTKNQSLLQVLGLPPEFGVALLVFCFALSVAPYLAGADFGAIKLPLFEPTLRKRLRSAGPVALLVALFLHLPIVPNKTTGEGSFSVTPTKRQLLTPPDGNRGIAAPPSPSRQSSTSHVALPSRDVTITYRVHLMLPISMSNATVRLDGREALVISRAPSVVTIAVPLIRNSHKITIEQEGSPPCAMTVAITKDDTKLTPCAN